MKGLRKELDLFASSRERAPGERSVSNRREGQSKIDWGEDKR